MKNCNLADESAANIIESSLGGVSKLSVIDFTGIEMGAKFITSLSKALEKDPKCLEELILANMKASVSIGTLADALMLS